MRRRIWQCVLVIFMVLTGTVAVASELEECLKPESQPLVEALLPLCEKSLTPFCIDDVMIGASSISLVRHRPPAFSARLVYPHSPSENVIARSTQFVLVTDTVPNPAQSLALAHVGSYLQQHEPKPFVWTLCPKAKDQAFAERVESPESRLYDELWNGLDTRFYPLLWFCGVFCAFGMGLFIFRSPLREALKGVGWMDLIGLGGLMFGAVLLRVYASPWVPLTSQGIEYSIPHLEYHLLHFVTYVLFSSPNIEQIQWANLVLSSVSCVNIVILSCVLGVKKKLAYLAGMLCAIWPYSIIYATSMRPMVASVMMLPWAIVGVYYVSSKPSWRYYFAAVLLALPYLFSRDEGGVVVGMLMAFGYCLYQTPRFSVRSVIHGLAAVVSFSIIAWIAISFETAKPAYWLMAGGGDAGLYFGMLLAFLRFKPQILSRMAAPLNWVFIAGISVILAAIMSRHGADNTALPFARYFLGMESVLTVAFVLGIQAFSWRRSWVWIGTAMIGMYLLVVGSIGYYKIQVPYNDQQDFRFLQNRVLPVLEADAVFVSVLDKDVTPFLDEMHLKSKYSEILHRPTVSMMDYLHHSATYLSDSRPVYFYAGLDTQAQFMPREFGVVSVLLRAYSWDLVAEERLPNKPFDYSAMDLGAVGHYAWSLPEGMPETISYRLFRLRKPPRAATPKSGSVSEGTHSR